MVTVHVPAVLQLVLKKEMKILFVPANIAGLILKISGAVIAGYMYQNNGMMER